MQFKTAISNPAPDIGHMRDTGPNWLAVRDCARGALRPYGPLSRLGILQSEAGSPSRP
jgi:hypothetical protein